MKQASLSSHCQYAWGYSMKMRVEKYFSVKSQVTRKGMRGYTIVELLVSILIAVILAVTIGVFFVKLLNIQEREREEAYIREKLNDICAVYADFLSIGSSFHISTNSIDPLVAIKYRLESGGVSLETGRVSRVAYLTAKVNKSYNGLTSLGERPIPGTMNLDVYSLEPEGLAKKVSSSVNGDAALMPLIGNVVSCTIIPLDSNISTDANGYATSDGALGLLRVAVQYEVENDEGELERKIVATERVVRLWNQK